MSSKTIVLGNDDVISFSIKRKLSYNNNFKLVDSNVNINNKNDIMQFIYATKPEYIILTKMDIEIEKYILFICDDLPVKKIINFIKKDVEQNYNSSKKLISILYDEVYGDNDNYDYNECSLFCDFLRLIHESKIYNLPNTYIEIDRNEKVNFIHSDDLANSTLHIIQTFSTNCIVDLKTGSNISLRSLGDLIKDIVEYNGNVICYESKEKPSTYKNTISNKIIEKRLDWMPKVTIRQGIRLTYNNLLDNNIYFYVTKFF